MKSIAIRYPGRVDYAAGLALQREAAERCRETGDETLLLLEHEPVFTLGRNASRAEILFTPDRCRELGISVFETDRGGRVTYHGPGQLVGYPILDLSPDRRDVKRYVTDLEESIIRTLRSFGIESARSPLKERVTSVWVGNDKIAAIGIHVSRWITTHGFALNISTNLEHFLGIIPCGISDGGVTSMERTAGRRFSLENVADQFVGQFAAIFDRAATVSAPRR
jgi:lipoyl(octanoyl) transferase